MEKIKQHINTVFLRIKGWSSAFKEHIVEHDLYYAVFVILALLCLLETIGVLRIVKIEIQIFLVIALLTTLIPIALAIFDVDKDESFVARRTIIRTVIQKVIDAQWVSFAFMFMVVPILIWEHRDNPDGYWLVIPSLLYIMGIYLICRTLIRSYNWIIQKERTKYILKYMDTSKDLEDTKEDWRSIWEIEKDKFTYQEERSFFDIFAKKIDKLFKEVRDNDSDAYNVDEIISHFALNLNKRPLYDIRLSGPILLKILEWNFECYEREKQSIYLGSSAVDWCFQRIVFLTLQNESKALPLYTFFKSFNKHLKKHQEDREYTYHLMTMFCREFFQGIEQQSDNGRYVWKHFPKEWMVTAQNWKDKENISSRASINEFLEWMKHKIVNPNNKEFDAVLEHASSSLFPETDPTIWSLILECFVSISPGEYREMSIKTIVERPSIFGMVGRVFSSWGEDEQKRQRDYRKSIEGQRAKSFELAWLLFGNLFSKENLEEYISILEKMRGDYDKDPREDRKREVLKSLFENMLKAKRGSVVG